ncbi:hypothetical protein MTO96_012646 [Rhipicephalus appendiculatus]
MARLPNRRPIRRPPSVRNEKYKNSSAAFRRKPICARKERRRAEQWSSYRPATTLLHCIPPVAVGEERVLQQQPHSLDGLLFELRARTPAQQRPATTTPCLLPRQLGFSPSFPEGPVCGISLISGSIRVAFEARLRALRAEACARLVM